MKNYFKILRPGINSTFQDTGRFGLQHLGIAPSGCMDKSLFFLANKYLFINFIIISLFILFINLIELSRVIPESNKNIFRFYHGCYLMI